ncbi:MAG: BsuPI-related putative proteinase inhibitor [Candidatus Hodarchaeota archaeon]
MVLDTEVRTDQEIYMHGVQGAMYPIPPTGKLRANVKVTNTADRPIKLNFINSQRCDFIIKDIHGKELVRWGHGQPFVEVIGDETIGPADSLSYSREVLLGKVNDPIPVGKYILEGIITASTIDLYNNTSFSAPIEAKTNFQIIDYRPEWREGFIFKKLHKFGTKSEGPDYYLQTEEGIDYLLFYKDHQLWEPDPELEKYACVWKPAAHIKVKGKIDLTKSPPKIRVDEIII